LAIASGTRLGPYEISSPIGSGGMGEVYKAKDTRLNRVVAIKVLRSHLADEPELKRRFEQEARAIAALNHPHICVLYDIGHQDGTDYLVMEYVEGETLAQRSRKGPLALEQVMRYATEIADALDRAHRHGVVHRDLKPANIMVTKSGTKLLDFGLAKWREPIAAAGAAVISDLPTESRDLTDERMIVGTLHYMAPEQLEGKKADARSDLFAFGAVVYEMATGRKAFEGSTAASVIASVLSSDPRPVSTLQPLTPPLLEYLVKTCLRKDPDERCQTAHEVLLQLRFLVESNAYTPIAVPKKVRQRWPLMAAMMLLIAAVGFVVGALYFQRPPEKVEVIRFSVSPPESTRTFRTDPAFFAVSPDGHNLAFEALDSSGRSSLWVRPLDSAVARPLPGTDEARRPSWSPDSRFIAFSAQGKLKKVDISGGFPQRICDLPSDIWANITWGQGEVIVFGDYQTGLLYSVPAAGGSPKPATTLDQSREERAHFLPHFLPDGLHFLYLAISKKSENSGVYIGSLGSRDSKGKRLLDTVSYTAYASPGYLLYGAGGSLMAQPFDATSLQASGEPIRVVEQVARREFSDFNWPAFSTSQTGVLAYRGGDLDMRRLAWLDRTGKQLDSVGELREYFSFAISPDEKTVAAERVPSPSNSDIWIIDLSRGTNSRFTSDPKVAFNPLWSPDAREIVFASTRDDPGGRYDNFYRKMSSGTDEEQALLKIDNVRIHQHPTDWSLDGQHILFDRSESEGKETYDLWVLPLFGNRTPFAFVQTKFDERGATFSPDARWVAYTSNESGRYEVYIRPFPKSEGKWQISTNGGEEPRWARNGHELFYRDPNRNLMGVPIKTGPKFEAGLPKALFEIGERRFRGQTSYVPSADGRRFLVPVDVENSNIAPPLTVIVNWTATLKK